MSPVDWVGQGREDNGWVVGLWDQICLRHTLHIFSRFMPLLQAETHSVWAIHLHTGGGDRPPTFNTHTHTHCEGWRASLKSRTMPYWALGSIKKCAALSDEMSDDSVVSPLDRDGLKLVASACDLNWGIKAVCRTPTWCFRMLHCEKGRSMEFKSVNLPPSSGLKRHCMIWQQLVYNIQQGSNGNSLSYSISESEHKLHYGKPISSYRLLKLLYM